MKTINKINRFFIKHRKKKRIVIILLITLLYGLLSKLYIDNKLELLGLYLCSNLWYLKLIWTSKY